jgi:hypothetical protein
LLLAVEEQRTPARRQQIVAATHHSLAWFLLVVAELQTLLQLVALEAAHEKQRTVPQVPQDKVMQVEVCPVLVPGLVAAVVVLRQLVGRLREPLRVMVVTA